MRDYLSFQNLRKAALLGAPMVVMSAPRILLSGFPFSFVIAAYAGLICFGGMATAWSREAGMRGLFPERKVMLRGIVVVVGLLIVIVPLQARFLNPLIYGRIEAAGESTALKLLFPGTIVDGLALMLWAMSFEALFFQGAVMSFFAKLTHRLSLTIILSVAVRVLVAGMKLDDVGVLADSVVVLFLVAIGSAISSTVFAFYGLPAVMLLAGGLSLSRWAFLWG